MQTKNTDCSANDMSRNSTFRNAIIAQSRGVKSCIQRAKRLKWTHVLFSSVHCFTGSFI